MGEEYGETAQFPYFTSHSAPDLIEGVRRGRREEHHAQGLRGDPPDPQDEATFLRAKLNPSLLEGKEHASLRRLYGDLLRLRRETLALRSLDLNAVETLADAATRTLLIRRHNTLLALNFSDGVRSVRLPWFHPWIAMIDTGARVEYEEL